MKYREHEYIGEMQADGTMWCVLCTEYHVKPEQITSRSGLLGLSRAMYYYVIEMMKQEGRNFEVCELCNNPIKGKFDIHHTKYEGATYYDLRIACRKCNLKAENVGLR